MKKTHRLILFLIGAFLLGGALLAIAVWHKPLANSLSLRALPVDPFAPFQASGSQPGATGSGRPVCNGPQSLTILAVGSDYRGDDYLYGLADVIRIVRVDFTKPAVSVLAIPRDVWVYLPGLSAQYGQPDQAYYGKINQAYFFGTPGMGYYQGAAGGAGYLAETLYANFGLYPDRYVVISMKALEELVDALGGVDIVLDAAVDGNYTDADGESQNLGYYPAGRQHFDGATALKFARIRYGYSDVARIDNQTLVLHALYQKATSSELLPRLPQILNAFLGKKVQTDLSPADVSTFLCLARKLDPGNIHFVTLPEETFSAESMYSPTQGDLVFAYVPDTQKVTELLHHFQSGTWP